VAVNATAATAESQYFNCTQWYDSSTLTLKITLHRYSTIHSKTLKQQITQDYELCTTVTTLATRWRVCQVQSGMFDLPVTV